MSVLILGADGKSLLGRTVEPMTVEQVRWFNDPVAFLTHVPHLWALKLRLYCCHCHKRGFDDHVRVRWNDVNGTFYVSCSCARTEGRLPMQAITHYAGSTDELLRRLGWSLCCTGRCEKERGFGDGVEAGNDPGSSTVSIRCACTERRYVMPQMSELVS